MWDACHVCNVLFGFVRCGTPNCAHDPRAAVKGFNVQIDRFLVIVVIVRSVRAPVLIAVVRLICVTGVAVIIGIAGSLREPLDPLAAAFELPEAVAVERSVELHQTTPPATLPSTPCND